MALITIFLSDQDAQELAEMLLAALCNESLKKFDLAKFNKWYDIKREIEKQVNFHELKLLSESEKDGPSIMKFLKECEIQTIPFDRAISKSIIS